MIETSLLAWLGFFVLFALSSWCGMGIARRMPWSEAAWQTNFARSVGFAIAPLMAGTAIVLALGLLRGASHMTHLLFVAGFLGAVGALAWFTPHISRRHPSFNENIKTVNLGIRLLFALWVFALCADTLLLPLMQNDSLEYATVARYLFETRDLLTYPAINPELSASGFYGPWTHPPLYVALLYLMEIIQGHADEPGLMRLVAPWFGLCAIYMVYTLGWLSRDRRTGVVAAIAFISTPMFFISVQSGLIDSLPILSLAMLVLLVIGLDVNARARSVWIGVALGMGLWTHSQAILFVPLLVAALCLQHGLKDWRRILKESLTVLFVALLIGAGPYIRNITIFGSLISDNPAVFAMPELNWIDYFRYARGLDNTSAIIQYGILKGWFALQFYGFIFWMMIPVLFFFLKQMHPAMIWRVLRDGVVTFDKPLQVLWVCTGLLLVYYAGVVLSVVIGLDLMIKNERYLLLIMPFVALIAGTGILMMFEAGLRKIRDPKTSANSKSFVHICFAGFCIAALLQLFVLGYYYHWHNIPNKRELDQFTITAPLDTEKPTRLEKILDVFPNERVVRWISKNIPADAVIFSLRPADMYYADHKMVSYLDPRMIPLYREHDPKQFAQELKKMGVQYIHAPDYQLPPAYNSVIKDLLARPDLTKLIYSSVFTQVYQLIDSNKRLDKVIDITPGKVQWTRWRKFDFGRRVLDIFRMAGKPYAGELSRVDGVIQFGHRDFSTILANGEIASFHASKIKTLQAVEPGREYKLSADLKGKGFIRVWLLQMSADGKILKEYLRLYGVQRVGEFVLTDPQEMYEFSRRFVTLPNARYVRVAIEHVGYSELDVEKVWLNELTDR